MSATNWEVRETISEHPAMILNGQVVPAHSRRTLSLGFLNVVALSLAEGFDINLDRGNDPTVWIAASEWATVRDMIESQFAWGATFAGEGDSA